jgi:hypothetical protein
MLLLFYGAPFSIFVYSVMSLFTVDAVSMSFIGSDSAEMFVALLYGVLPPVILHLYNRGLASK